jgi:amino acid adenylation domain-containing protein
MGVLARELEVLYAARLRGEHSPLPELAVQYADYAAWQRNYLSGELLTSQLGYWKRQLAGVPVLELPTDRPRPALQSFRGAAHTVVLSADLSQALKELGRREDATPFMTLLAAFQLVLGRWSGQDDFAVGTPVAGRTRAETEPLIGFFLNNLVLRAELTEDPSFRALLGRVRETTLGAFAHQEIPFERLLEELQPPRDLGRTPLFQVLFNLIPLSEADRLRLEGVESRAVGQGDPEAKFDLTLYATEGDRIRLRLVYNTDLFDSETAERLLAGLEQLLASAVAAPERRISTLPLLDPAERARLASGVAEPRPDRAFEPIPASVLDSSIAARFREVAARMPDAPAVESGETVWSYGELASRADRVSHAVWSAVGGVVEGRVALLLGHDAGMVAGVLGVLGAGQAYVPLDPYAPADRLRRILADAAPSAIVTDGAHRALLETLEPAVPVVELESAWALAVDGPVEVEIGPDAAAYLLYTSGSTGEPKGVVQSQRGVLHHVRTYVNRLHVGSGDRLSLLSAYGFDASVMDLFGALLSGATLVPLDLRGAAVGRLATEVAERGITVYHSTPTVYRHLVAGLGAAERLAGVRLVVLGGEAVVGADVDRYRRHFAAGCLLVNGLGPTECTLALQQWLDHGVELERGEVPVGGAVEGVEAEVVNEAGEPVAEWATGELVLRSRYLAQGYWGRPDLTAAAFGEGDEAGVRIYRTGDLGRRLPDGRIVFVGRRDGQVKVRGYRIETGEVESALVAQAGVREAVVLLREAEGGEPELAAYVVPAVGARVPGAAELREAVRNRLPEYMVPAAYAAIDAVPMTANGKVDRRALLAMEVERAGGAAASEYAAPRTPLEEVLVGIWQEVLGVEEVGIQASFFELGGHSLRAMQVVSRIRVVLGVELPLRALFEAPSVAELAARVERLRRGDAEEADMLPPVEPVERDGPQPLSFAQQRLWFLQQLEPESTAYNLRSAVRLKGELDVSALRRAFDAVVARHESLRTVFREVDGEPRQVVLEAGPAALEFEDLSGLEAVERESAVAGRVSAAAGWIFDLNEGPLFRGWLLRLGEAEHVLVVVKHHIITDGWSMRLLTGEIGRLYAAYRAGGEAVLPALPIQYADYAVWQRRYRGGAGAGAGAGVLEGSAGGSGAAGAAGGPGSSGEREHAGGDGGLPSAGGAAGGVAAAERAGGLDAGDDDAGGVPGAAGPVHGTRGRGGGEPDREPTAARGGGSDRVLREHAGAADGPVGLADVPGAGGAGAGDVAGGAAAPEPAVRAAGGGAPAGAGPDAEPAGAGGLRGAERAALGGGDAGGGGGGGARRGGAGADGPGAPPAGGPCGAGGLGAGGGVPVRGGPVRPGTDRAAARALRAAAGAGGRGRGGAALRGRPPGRLRAVAAAGGVEPDGVGERGCAAAGYGVRDVRGAGGSDAGGGGGLLWRATAELRGAGWAREPGWRSG